MSFPPAAESLVLAGPAGALEAVIEDPQPPVVERFAVVCHPHPLHGGAMTNKVTHTLARTLQEIGVPTIRFNFRGVGKSAGAFDEGAGEVEDVLAAVSFGRERWKGAHLWLAGFSFGGYVALRAAQRAGARRLITVAPAVTKRFGSPRDIPVPDCPWTIIQGDADDVVDAAEVRVWTESLHPRPDLIVVPGVDHFFNGRLPDLKDAVLAGIVPRH